MWEGSKGGSESWRTWKVRMVLYCVADPVGRQARTIEEGRRLAELTVVISVVKNTAGVTSKAEEIYGNSITSEHMRKFCSQMVINLVPINNNNIVTFAYTPAMAHLACCTDSR